jgi:hypothetical protein
LGKLILLISHQRNHTIAVAKGLACLFLLLVACAFHPKPESIHNSTDTEIGKQLVTLHSDEFKSFTNRIYRQLEYPMGFDTLTEEVLAHALRGYIYLKHTQELTNTKYLTIIDFSQYCNDRRMWVIDLENKKVVFNEWVAHGAKSGDTYAKYFSNSHRSNRSSLGFYTTGDLYNGRNSLSLKLNGLEKGFNNNAFSRGIVIHGANYVSKNIVNRNERIGRSFGCPAVRQDVNKALVNTIKGGNCLFIWHPTPHYLANSKLLNANLYVTVDDLSI